MNETQVSQAWPYEEDVTPMSQPKKKQRSTQWATGFAVFGKMAKIIKAVKAIKILQPLLSFGSMVASVFAYSFAMGLAFAIGFVVMLFLHEMGHAIALKRRGMKASLPVFIPFLGAAIFAPSFGNRDDEAHMAFAGPFFGSLSAVVLFAVALLTPGGHPLLLGIANVALIINLFNLIPISPLDGGRVTQAVGPAFKFVGVAALLALTIYLQTPGLIVIWVLVLMDLRIRNVRRLIGGVILESVALFMMLANIGTPQPFWINVMDVVIMTIFNLMFFFSWRYGNERDLVTPDDRPQLTRQARLRWLAAYGALVVALVIMSLVVNAQLSVYIAA